MDGQEDSRIWKLGALLVGGKFFDPADIKMNHSLTHL
jgi:hypothetical protein